MVTMFSFDRMTGETVENSLAKNVHKTVSDLFNRKMDALKGWPR